MKPFPSTTPQKPGSAEDYRAKWLEAIDTITTLGRLEEKLKAERAEIAKLLHETAGMCRMSVFNVHDNRMEEQAKKLNDAAFSLGASVPSAIRQSREEAYRRAFVLLLAEVMASGWFHADPSMKAKVVAYLHTANLDNENFTVEKVLHDAMGIPTDADRAFVANNSPDGGKQAT